MNYPSRGIFCSSIEFGEWETNSKKLNPARNHLFINTGEYSSMNGNRINITNQLGDSVFETKLEEYLYNVSLSNWSGPGLYFIRVIETGGKLIDIRKIVLPLIYQIHAKQKHNKTTPKPIS
jgi:hypothetical protein